VDCATPENGAAVEGTVRTSVRAGAVEMEATVVTAAVAVVM
jgi:hypothetical protein